MSQPNKDSLLARAARGEKTERTPVWLMRQAGRTDPEYNRLKEEAGLPLEDLFNHPEWSARLSLLPQRVGMDAIILFQDILTPLAPLGAPFVFRPGPLLTDPIRHEADLGRLHGYDVSAELSFVPETLRLIQQQLDGALPVLGFAGAPLTLAIFMIEGQSFSKSIDSSLVLLQENGPNAHRLLQLITDVIGDYLLLQAEAGVAAVQLFESAAFLLSREIYDEFALPYQQQIFERLKGIVPGIMFAREWPHVQDLKDSGADILSLPAQISIAEARATLGDDTILQGNVDNHLLVDGSPEAIVEAVQECVRQGGHRGHIFNLSHGLLRETPFEHVKLAVKTARETILTP